MVPGPARPWRTTRSSARYPPGRGRAEAQRQVRLADVTFRSPQPGHDGQRLHADDVPLAEPGPGSVVTAIVALCDFTATNGATSVVPGSHRRPDLQRHSGALERHPDEVVPTGPAGTAFVFCGHLLHRGTTNRSAAPCPALQVVWRRATTAPAPAPR